MARAMSVASNHGKQIQLHRGSSRIGRTRFKPEAEPTLGRSTRLVTPKLAIAVVQRFEPRNEAEANDWLTYAEAIHGRNAKHLSVIRNFGNLSITLVGANEIAEATALTYPDEVADQAKHQQLVTKLRRSLSGHLAEQPITYPKAAEETEALDSLIGATNPASEYAYYVSPTLQPTNHEQAIGLTLRSRTLPRLRNQVRNYLFTEFGLDVPADPTPAGVDYRLALWPIISDRPLQDMALRTVDEKFGPPPVISMSRPETEA